MVVRYVEGKEDPPSRGINGVKARRGTHAAAVAWANKNSRILWTLPAKDHHCHPAQAAA